MDKGAAPAKALTENQFLISGSGGAGAITPRMSGTLTFPTAHAQGWQFLSLSPQWPVLVGSPPHFQQQYHARPQSALGNLVSGPLGGGVLGTSGVCLLPRAGPDIRVLW
jgi:hypothetical protein